MFLSIFNLALQTERQTDIPRERERDRDGDGDGDRHRTETERDRDKKERQVEKRQMKDGIRFRGRQSDSTLWNQKIKYIQT